jgi:hypothetical protein
MKTDRGFAKRPLGRIGLRFAKAAFEIARLFRRTVYRNIPDVWSKQTTSEDSFSLPKLVELLSEKSFIADLGQISVEPIPLPRSPPVHRQVAKPDRELRRPKPAVSALSDALFSDGGHAGKPPIGCE